MAEVVQSHVEDMLPEIYELQQLGVLSSEEAKLVIKTRTDFEYKMRRRVSKKLDFVKFIDYEVKLETLKQRRLKKMGVGEVSEHTKYRSLQRIHFIFQKCLRKYKSDVPLWLKYIKYCQQVSSARALGLAFVEALKHNPNAVELWILSAKHEMEQNKNTSSARAIFLKGLKFNSQSADLWIEYFRLEVLHAEKLLKRQLLMGACDKALETDKKAEFLEYKTAKIVFSNAMKSFDLDGALLGRFIGISSVAEQAEGLTQHLFNTSLTARPRDPAIWCCLARHVAQKDAEQAHALLRRAAALIPTSECILVIIRLLQANQTLLLSDLPKTIASFIPESRIFPPETEQPSTLVSLRAVLSEVGLESKIEPMLECALSKFPTDKSLWQIRLEMSPELANYTVALEVLPEDCQIWKQYLALLEQTDTEECLAKWREVMKKGFSRSLAGDYLQFVFNHQGGIDGARAAFAELQTWNTVPEEGLKVMLTLEKESGSSSKRIDQLFSELVTNYGSLANWRDYMQFCNSECPEKSGDVLWRCKKLYSDNEIATILQ